jgi:tRNA threonylcarbamoyladenosine biosynthesis protein TsaB
VSRGPGSFTGVRIGVLAAKSLAWTLVRPLAGVPTFEALAAGSGAERAGVVIDARIRQVYFTLLRREDGRWRAELPDQVAPPADAAARLPAGITLVGTALRTWPDAFPRTRFVWAPEETWEPRAAVVARLGEERFRREGRGDDVLGLEPYYLRALAVRTMEEGVSGLEA